MKIEQHALLKSIITEFQFNDETMGYAQESPTSARGVAYDIAYEDIPQETKTIKVPNRRFLQLVRYGRYAFIALAVGVLLSKYGHDQNVDALLVLPAAMLIAASLSARNQRIIMIEIPTKKGKVQIIKDGQEETILKEIETRRKNRILDLYGEIDFSKAPHVEIGKFEWLKDNRYITAEDAEEAIQKIKDYHNNLRADSAESNESAKTEEPTRH